MGHRAAGGWARVRNEGGNSEWHEISEYKYGGDAGRGFHKDKGGLRLSLQTGGFRLIPV